jgi:hypothetical protein
MSEEYVEIVRPLNVMRFARARCGDIEVVMAHSKKEMRLDDERATGR